MTKHIKKGTSTPAMPSLCYYTFFVRHLNAKYLSHWYTDCESWM